MTPILMMTSFSRQEERTASTWIGLRFTSLDTVWVWSIPTCVNLSCTRGTRVTCRTLSLRVMISREFKHFTVSCVSCIFGTHLFGDLSATCIRPTRVFTDPVSSITLLTCKASGHASLRVWNNPLGNLVRASYFSQAY